MLIGSKYFFSCYEDFNSKDTDELELVETGNFQYVSWLHNKNRCIFRIKKMPTLQDHINYALRQQQGLVIGKFLVPEFCQSIGFTIDDLPKLSPLIKLLDEKHKYEEIIYDSYLKNGDFILTEEQRRMAYDSYKKSRGEK